MITRDEALQEYVMLFLKKEEALTAWNGLAKQLEETEQRLKEYKAIIFAEQVKPQREPRKGGYQPRGRSKEIVGKVLAESPKWLTSRQIRETCNLSDDQVLTALAELRREGFVVREGSQGRHIYTLTIKGHIEENENQDNSNDSIGKLSDVPSFVQLVR